MESFMSPMVITRIDPCAVKPVRLGHSFQQRPLAIIGHIFKEYLSVFTTFLDDLSPNTENYSVQFRSPSLLSYHNYEIDSKGISV